MYTNIPKLTLSYACEPTEKVFATDSKTLSDLFRASFGEAINIQECFKVLFFKANMEVIGIQNVSMGGKAATIIDNKILFSAALLANASGIALCHNHPSGSVRPSPEDLRLTKKIQEAAKMLDIQVIDHIILTDTEYLSMSDEGIIIYDYNTMRNQLK